MHARARKRTHARTYKRACHQNKRVLNERTSQSLHRTKGSRKVFAEHLLKALFVAQLHLFSRCFFSSHLLRTSHFAALLPTPP